MLYPKTYIHFLLFVLTSFFLIFRYRKSLITQMKTPVKQFLYALHEYSKKDRNGIIVLSFLFILLFCLAILSNSLQFKGNYDLKEAEKIMDQWQQQISLNSNNHSLFTFNPNQITKTELDTLLLSEQIKRNILKYREAGGYFKSKADLRKIYGMTDSIFEAIEPFILIPKQSSFEVEQNHTKQTTRIKQEIFFDPNTTSYDTLIKVGFSSSQAKNLMKYREKGGRIFSETDLMKIYGIDSIFYNSVKHLIQIQKNTFNSTVSIKSEKPLIIDINSADSLALVKLPGIGPVFAIRIIKYRNLLGGFYKKEQLLEVYNFKPETYAIVEPYIFVDTVYINKIRINFASYNELIRHPYLNKEQVNSILQYRNKHGAFVNIKSIEGLSGFNTVDYNKIEYYLTWR